MNESVADLERDRLWCRALIETCDTTIIERVLARFNYLRNPPGYKPPPAPEGP